MKNKLNKSSISTKGGILTTVYFADKIQWWQKLGYFFFYRAFHKSRFIHLEKEFYSLVIDLHQTPETIFANFSSTTRNEIHKGKQYLFEYFDGESYDEVQNLHQKMLAEKHMDSNLDYIYNSPLKDILLFTSCRYKSKIIVGHAYMIDPVHNFVDLRYSFSSFRDADHEWKKMVSIANRCLHYHDILLFKQKGLDFYDFGGYAKDVPIDDPKYGINKFKLGFGGELKTYYSYYTYPYMIRSKLYIMRQKIKTLFKKN